MKYILSFILSAILAVTIAGCSSCADTKDKKNRIPNAEVIISLDKGYVYFNYGSNYKWYETEFRFVDYIDNEGNCEIDELVNVFQYQNKAIKCQHYDGITEYGWAYGLWVGDHDLNEENVVVTLAEAFTKMKRSNYVLPHSRYCTLRKEVGPKPNINPQYIFGNVQRQIYVDAVTGEVTDKNPAYDNELDW